MAPPQTPDYKNLAVLGTAAATAVATLIATPVGMFVAAMGTLGLIHFYWPRLLRARGLLSALGVALIAAVTAAGLVLGAVKTVSPNRSSEGSGSVGQTTTAPPGNTTTTPPPPPSPSQPKRKKTWSEICSADPGAGAPDFAAGILHKLYLGPQLENVDPPPGAPEGGCTTPSYSPPGFEDKVVYTQGFAEGMMKSFAVVSRARSYALFLAPAAKVVSELATEYRDIGGWPRTDVGNDGDYYGVTTGYGTIILTRSSKVEDYVVLRPPVASSWLTAMRQCNCWLWALPAGSVHGKDRIRLVANLETNKTISSIFVDTAKDEARLGGESATRTKYGFFMNPEEVWALAG